MRGLVGEELPLPRIRGKALLLRELVERAHTERFVESARHTNVKENWKLTTELGELILATFDLLSIAGVEKEIPIPMNAEGREGPNTGLQSDAPQAPRR